MQVPTVEPLTKGQFWDRRFCPLQRGFPSKEVDFFVPENNDDNIIIID